MKKLFYIFLAFAVLALGMQSPCSAVPDEDGCKTTQCCKDDQGDADNKAPAGDRNDNDNCCVYNVLSFQQAPVYINDRPRAVVIKNLFNASFFPDAYPADFWQPPRQT